MAREKLAEDFYRDEFECGCGCGLDRVDLQFVNKLQLARTIADIPFIISSGVRCKEHNKNVGGKPDSAHLPEAMPDGKAHAADIEITSSRQRKIVVSALLDAGFTRIGVGKSLVHVDDGELLGVKDEDVLWTYNY